MKRSVRSVIAGVVVTAIALPAFSSSTHANPTTVIDEGWAETRTLNSGGHQSVRFRDVPESWERVSALLARLPKLKACTSTTVEPCSSAPTISFISILQPCTSSGQLDCIVEFGTVGSDNVRTPATYTTPFPKKAVNEFAAEPSIGLPPGGPGGLWTVAESSGAPIRTHYLGAMVSGETSPGKQVSFNNFYATISPVEIVPLSCDGTRADAVDCAPGYVPDSSDPPYYGFVDSFGREQGLDCVMSGNYISGTRTADCALRKAISKEVTYYLTIRLSQAVSGWMHGRMAEPDITIENVAGTSGAVTISIAAKAVSLPAVDVEKRWVDLPANLQDAYRKSGKWDGTVASGYGNFAFLTDPLERNRESRPSSFGEQSIEELQAWLPVVNDKAVADLSTWAVRSLGSNQLGAADGCITEKNKLAGIVSTNATVYKAAAPVYDTSTQSLSYTVAAPHYMSSGELFKGAYSLIIRSDIARCIYKFDSAPITSTIEVIDTGGQTATAVTNVSEKDGWINLQASGFTHSTPTIRAKMTQAKTSDKTGAVAGPSSPSQTTTGPKARNVKRGRSVAASQITKWAGLKTTKKSKVALSVKKSPRGVCFVKRSAVVASSKGTCVVTVTMRTGAKRTVKTVNLRIT